MWNAISLAIAVAFALSIVASGAQAEKCEGMYVRNYEQPIPVHKGEDGSQSFHIQSTGTTIRKTPDNSPLSGNWQHCTGLWTVKADKSGSGSGNCYAVDSDGDQWITSWEGDDAGGTWQSVSGTGKYANNASDQGTWKPGKRFPNGMRTGYWDGECAD